MGAGRYLCLMTAGTKKVEHRYTVEGKPLKNLGCSFISGSQLPSQQGPFRRNKSRSRVVSGCYHVGVYVCKICSCLSWKKTGSPLGYHFRLVYTTENSYLGGGGGA